MKKPFFPRDFEGTKPSKITKIDSQRIVFAIISWQEEKPKKRKWMLEVLSFFCVLFSVRGQPIFMSFVSGRREA